MDSIYFKEQTASIISFTRRILTDAAIAWRYPQLVVLGIVTLPFFIAFSGILVALLHKWRFKWLTHEDGPIENLQVLIYGLAAIFCIITIIKLWQSGDQWIAVLYSGIIIIVIFIIGEEISWGQRIFEWATPAYMEELNRQGEMNLHNIRGIELSLRFAQIPLGAYGTIMPLIALHPDFLRHYRGLIPRFIPHYTLIPYFFLLFSWRVIHNLTPLTRVFRSGADEYSEVIELILAIGVCLFMLFQVRQFRKSRGLKYQP